MGMVCPMGMGIGKLLSPRAGMGMGLRWYHGHRDGRAIPGWVFHIASLSLGHVNGHYRLRTMWAKCEELVMAAQVKEQDA